MLRAPSRLPRRLRSAMGLLPTKSWIPAEGSVRRVSQGETDEEHSLFRRQRPTSLPPGRARFPRVTERAVTARHISLADSEDCWHLVAGLTDATLHVHLREEHAAEHEEDDEREDRGAV